MFQEKSVMFIYTVSPLHMGAGTALGGVDNPIQRERHTQHPMLAGSGLKGALRDAWPKEPGPPVDLVFGPDTEHASEHAGAVSFSDGQIVLFPVRCLRQSYVYTTCPTALARLNRMLGLVGLPLLDLPPTVQDDTALLVPDSRRELCAGENQDARLTLESFRFRANGEPTVKNIAQKLGDWLPQDLGRYFRDKVAQHLVVLSDTRFNYFVRNSTILEPHVRIDDATGTADDGGLYYIENVPPETLFASLIMASEARANAHSEKGANGVKDAKSMLGAIRKAFHQRFVQVGGDATSGRGQVFLSFVGGDQ